VNVVMPDSALERARRRGRRIGIAVYATILSAFIVATGAEVMYQGFASPAVSSPRDCHTGITELLSALRRAREAAVSEPLGERASLERFRRALLPEWQKRSRLTAVCESDPWAIDALSAIDQLRYAEEHAVRYESVDLAPSRRRVVAIEQSLGTHTHGGP
jgi:hypothetical protein